MLPDAYTSRGTECSQSQQTLRDMPKVAPGLPTEPLAPANGGLPVSPLLSSQNFRNLFLCPQNSL
eukprot:3028977-Amphidinium_carterae.2